MLVRRVRVWDPTLIKRCVNFLRIYIMSISVLEGGGCEICASGPYGICVSYWDKVSEKNRRFAFQCESVVSASGARQCNCALPGAIFGPLALRVLAAQTAWGQKDSVPCPLGNCQSQGK